MNSPRQNLRPAVELLHDENAASLVWRLANTRRTTVAEICEQELGLSYSQARGDLDDSLPNKFAQQFAHYFQLNSGDLSRLRIGSAWLSPVFRPVSKRFNRPTPICFRCMTECRYGRRLWRTKFASVCPIHACLLVSTCPNCGAEIRYQEGNVGLAPLHWLETWPVCTNCLRTMQPKPEPGDRHLVQITSKWAVALSGRRPYPWISSTQFLKFSSRLICSFECNPMYIAARSQIVSASIVSPQQAAAMVLRRVWRAPTPLSVLQAALNLRFDAYQLSKDMVS